MTTDHADLGGSAASRSVEIELKFDVDDTTPLPDWSALPGVVSVGPAELRELDAAYLDTEDLSLAQAGYALRRRTGGPDEGWHIKGPRRSDGGRIELHWPLEATTGIPEAVASTLAPVASSTAFGAIARIRNTRTAYALRDASGALVAEFVDDHVTATDERHRIERRWREWEFELGPAAPASPDARASLLAAATDAVHAAGGRAAASASKLARALGV